MMGKMTERPRQILIVEDYDDIADSIRDILEAEGYAVSSVRTGEGALDALDTNGQFDLILLDMKLPDMSGGELFSVLQDLSQFQTPVVAVTASKQVPPMVSAVLHKPFDVDSLLNIVREQLR